MKTYLTYGLGMAFVGAVIGLVGFFAGVGANSGILIGLFFGFLGLLIPIIGIPLAIRAWREGEGKGFMSFGSGVGAGFFVSLWWGLGAAVWQLIYSTVINPEMRQQIIDKQAEAFERMPDEQRRVAEAVSGFMLNPAVQFGVGVIFCCVFGVVIALIASAILKREPIAVVSPPPIA